MLDKRSIANFKLSMLVAKESRTYPGDATNADPVCHKSPEHEKVIAFVDAAQRRDDPNDYLKIQKQEQQTLADTAEVPVVWYRSDHNSLHLSKNGT